MAKDGGKGDSDVSIDMKKMIQMPNLPKPLTTDEKKFLLAVERGDLPTVRRVLQRMCKKKNLNVNCLDPLGRGAMSIAIDGENLEMVELLVIMGVKTNDALLHAINVGFVEAVELLLEHEELVHKEGTPYSWETVDVNTSVFTTDMTPLILAAHRNNYEILKILLDRGATLPMPHDVRCGCEECIKESEEDPLRFSTSRLNQYRALASPSLIALSSSDPILTAFELSWDLRNLAFTEQENKAEYMELRRQCQKLAVSLLDQTRSSHELAIILNHDPQNPPYEDGEHMTLARLEQAITYKQKKFVAHPKIQQLLASIWYEGLPGFRRKSLTQKAIVIGTIIVLFPFYCMLYMIAPNTNAGKLMRKPFMKFLMHSSSYLFFLLLLIMVSQRAEIHFEELIVTLFGSDAQKENFANEQRRQRGNGPMILECFVGIYVLGFLWEETFEMWTEGIRKYLRNMWNFIDFMRNSLYVGVFMLRCLAYWQQRTQILNDPATAFIPREEWDAFDPQLIAEGLFAAANVFSALKLVHMFSINPHLGPLQISLGRMVIDIVKFFSIYSLVLFAFACGLNQLLWYFAELERRKCYSLPGDLPDWDNHGDSCSKWRSFGNLFESSQSLFWASFGGVGIDSFDLTGIKTYTRFWGLLMFGSYSVINVIVLLNLLIAMMSNSYAMIVEHSDVEWKFARTKLWMSYFEESATLPPPFNIMPTPKLIFKLLGMRKKDKLRRMSTKRKERQEKERDYRYTAVMRCLVWRYISNMQRAMADNPLTEDDVNEIKGEINGMRYELLDVLEKNGLDVSSANTKSKTVLGKKMKVWERRLLKDFHLAPVANEEEMDSLMMEPPPDEDPLSRFRRIAKLAVLDSTQQKWREVVRGACKASQIGHCISREGFKNKQCLQKAMDEARKLMMRSPKGVSRASSPSLVSLTEITGSHIMDILNDFTQETAASDEKKSLGKGGGGGGTMTNNLLFAACNKKGNKSSSPRMQLKSASDPPANKTVSRPVTPGRPAKLVPTLSVDPPSTKESLDKQMSIDTKPAVPTTLPTSPRHSCMKQKTPDVPPRTKNTPDSPSNSNASTSSPTESIPPTITSPRKTVSICSPKKVASPTKQPRGSPWKSNKTPLGSPAKPKPPTTFSSPTNSTNAFAQFTTSQDCLILPGSPEENRVRSRPTSPRFSRQPKNGWF